MKLKALLSGISVLETNVDLELEFDGEGKLIDTFVRD